MATPKHSDLRITSLAASVLFMVTKLFQFIYHCHRLQTYNDTQNMIKEMKQGNLDIYSYASGVLVNETRRSTPPQINPLKLSDMAAKIYVSEYAREDSNLNTTLYGVTVILAIICIADILLGIILLLGTLTRALQMLKYATMAATLSLCLLIFMLNVLELANLFSIWKAVLIIPSIPTMSLLVYSGTLTINWIFFKLEENRDRESCN